MSDILATTDTYNVGSASSLETENYRVSTQKATPLDSIDWGTQLDVNRRVKVGHGGHGFSALCHAFSLQS